MISTPLGHRCRIHGAVATVGVRRSAVAIGQFDGVHRGHRTLLAEARRQAAHRGWATGAVTFDRHPISLLAPGRQPAELTSLEEKVDRLLGCGLDFVAVLHVEPALLATDPAVFADDVLVATLDVGCVVVGSDFRFGRGASGDVELLTALGRDRGFDVRCPPLVRYGGTVVSSTRIRAAISSGDTESALAMLGGHV